MPKFELLVMSALVLAAVSACDSAKSPDKVESNVAAAQAKAASEVADAQRSAAKDVDAAQDKMNGQGVELSNTNAKATYDVAIAKAEGDHKVASAKCDALAGDAQKSCRDVSDAEYELAKSRAKATLDAQKR
jgi:Tfp pilus assembly major pilin PilA